MYIGKPDPNPYVLYTEGGILQFNKMMEMKKFSYTNTVYFVSLQVYTYPTVYA